MTADPDIPRSEPTSQSSWLPSADLGESPADPLDRRTRAGATANPRPGQQRPPGRGAAVFVLVGVSLAVGATIGVVAGGGNGSPGAADDTISAFDEQPSGEPIAGAVGPSKALTLAVAVRTEDDRASDRGRPAFDPDVEASVGPTTTTPIRAKYVLRLAAVGALLRELGREASGIRDAAGLDREDERVRELLQRLDAVAGDFEDSIYRRSRDLDTVVAATIAATQERLGAGREEELRRLGRRLSALGGSITRKVEDAAAAAVDDETIRAGRLFEKADRRLAALGRTV